MADQHVTLDWGREKVHLASGRYRHLGSGFKVEEALCGYVIGSTPKESTLAAVDAQFVCKRCLKRAAGCGDPRCQVGSCDPRIEEVVRRALRRFRSGVYVIGAGETRPTPVIPDPHPSPAPIPSRVDRENARRFLESKQGQQSDRGKG
jgi:hypothetical protein